MKSVTHSKNWTHYGQLRPATPALPDAISPLVMYTTTVHRLLSTECTNRRNNFSQHVCFPSKHKRKYTITKQHKRICRNRDPVTCRTSTDSCRVYTIQIQVTPHPWLCMTVHAVLIGGATTPPPPPRITNCSQPQHSEPPVSQRAAVVTWNRSPTPMSTDTINREPARTESTLGVCPDTWKRTLATTKIPISDKAGCDRAQSNNPVKYKAMTHHRHHTYTIV